jgi:hypothetical protein
MSYGRAEVELHAFLMSTQCGSERSGSEHGHFILEEELAIPIRYKAVWLPEQAWTMFCRQ